MTCREFKQNTEALPLLEFIHTQEPQLLEHAQQCAVCGAWTREQRALAASLHALQARTATVQAGPKVEEAIFQAFRQKHAGDAQVLAKSEPASQKSVPAEIFAFRLSRWFEIGAYAAVAAAIGVGLFLSVRLVHRNSTLAPVQSQSSPPSSRQEPSKQAATAEPESQNGDPVSLSAKHTPGVQYRQRIVHRMAEASVTRQPSPAQESQVDEAGYVPLMFCDPLSCSADSQVVRMELVPNPASQGSQPQLADVVVGYDGVVRAVRMVN
ncbi:MAG TPA: hypothetical protein VKB58_03970 [Terriglobales bacterium]|jgi:hypothetical protein|nr:hypothetical protein [Terriglobales bacterium]